METGKTNQRTWVVDTSVASGHGALHEDDVLGFPNLDHGHSGDGGGGILFGRRVDRVVGSDDLN